MKALRLRAFEERGGWDGCEVVDVPHAGSYIAIHPLSDEVDILQAIGAQPASCIKVDCYWRFDEDVHLVQIESTSYAPDATVGFHARIEGGEGYAINILVITETAPIDRATLERTLLQAVDLLREKPVLGKPLRQLR